MRFAEVFLRLGSAMVGWMLLYAYFLWLAALHVVACGPDGDEMHRLLLGMAPLACGGMLMVRATRQFGEIQKMLRWLTVPLLLLLPLALRSTWSVVTAVNIQGGTFCSVDADAGWQQAWAPLQFLALAWICISLVRNWLNSREAGAAARP